MSDHIPSTLDVIYNLFLLLLVLNITTKEKLPHVFLCEITQINKREVKHKNFCGLLHCSIAKYCKTKMTRHGLSATTSYEDSDNIIVLNNVKKIR